MHSEAFTFVRDVAGQLGPVPAVLEIGARNINGTVRGLFAQSRYLATDLRPGPGVDLVADGATGATASEAYRAILRRLDAALAEVQ